MNWNQLYTTCTPEERLQMMLQMIRTLEQRERRLILVGGRVLRNRRRALTAHFIGDRRIYYKQRRHKTLRIAGLMLATAVIWSGVIFMQPLYATLVLTLFNLALISVLLVRPHLQRAYSLQFRSELS